MNLVKVSRALLSVTDKDGIVDFARQLIGYGVELISTGGTYKVLSSNGIPVTEVAEVTKMPEMMDGRLKTIHPVIAGGILAHRGKGEHMQALASLGAVPIDLVVVNLYDFRSEAARQGSTLDEMVEKIDIGGPTMIRAAAKNWRHVGVVTSPRQYGLVDDQMKQEQGHLSEPFRFLLMTTALKLTGAYDTEIFRSLDLLYNPSN